MRAMPPARRRAVISPYRSFGTAAELVARGRVLTERHITRASEAEPLWRNVLNTYRRVRSHELGGARVRAMYGDTAAEGITDREGYFAISLRPAGIDPGLLWHDVTLTLPDLDATATASVLVPPADAELGVISDIDDTVVVTNATSLRGMVRSVLRNAATRLPFDGVAELYRALHRDRNPLFYVSSSPWNLYELLHDFMDLNGIPHGPMLLQDYGLDRDTLILSSHTTHKLAQIHPILDLYPHLRFVLIGDSGQRDPEIYLRVIQANPQRIAAAFIRDVSPDLRDRAVARILEQSNALGVEMLYVRDSAEAMTHMKRLGLTP
jgi:phosphatidate phosphatase APP1